MIPTETAQLQKVAATLGARAHQQNEASGGKEGGRIVRKLVSDLVEIPIQDAATEHPDRNRAASRIRISVPTGAGDASHFTDGQMRLLIDLRSPGRV